MFRSEIQKQIQDAVAALYPDAAGLQFDAAVSDQAEHGDYSSNVALALSRQLKRNPIEIADELGKKLSASGGPFRAETAEPGFINFFIADEKLSGFLRHVIDNPEKFGESTIGAGKTVMVEYFQLNIAKRPHIGHIRSAIIGDALKRMFLSQGYRAISDTHVGDWGTQFGILISVWKHRPDEFKNFEEDPFGKLDQIAEFYKEASQGLIELTPELRRQRQRGEDIVSWHEAGKQEFAKLEQGDQENRKIWQYLIGPSLQNLEKSANRLGLLPFDEHRGESFYEDMMPPIVESALEKNVAKKTKEGAVLVDLTNEGLDEAVLVKSDGASTYLLRDLATIQYRKKQWSFWKNLYVVDVRQSHHFKQVFRVAELLSFDGAGESEHVEYGFMKLPEGSAISTRGGTGISLEKVLDEAERRAAAVIAEKNPNLANTKEIARMVGLGALKYFDLLHHRRSDITFDWDRALSFEGNTGPYLQYTHARLKSILRKSDLSAPQLPPGIVCGSTERNLLTTLVRLPEAIEDGLAIRSPHVLAGYLYELAVRANELYHAAPILAEADEEKKQFLLSLIFAVSSTLKKGLNMLGIEAPEEM